MPMVLGLNAFHGDSSACILGGGRLIAAAEEERFRRVKHWAGFPSAAIDYCLKEAGVTIADVEHVAVNRNARANAAARAKFLLVHPPEPRLAIAKLRNIRSVASVRERLAQSSTSANFSGTIHGVEHHVAHMASAFLASPMDEAAIVSVDGSGDFATAAWGIGHGTAMSIDGKVYFPHSLGIFYEALTQYLGFGKYGDEYKVMGLASYGEPRFLDQMGQLVRLLSNGEFRLNLAYFRHHRSETQYEWDDCAPSTTRLYTDRLMGLLGPMRASQDSIDQRHMDIARSTQVMYETALFNLLNVLYKKYGATDLVLAGGSAMNSVANGKIRANTPFKNVYIQSAAGDAGGALGAALHVQCQLRSGSRAFAMDHAYWGPSYSTADMDTAIADIRHDLDRRDCRVELIRDEQRLCDRTAAEIATGKVVGWFQGRMEWGPRALGNRSILCDPRRSEMRDILNLKVKRRESFRPFAPSVLREAVSEWFEEDDDVPFMMKVYPIREEKRALVPAVTHVDGTGRLQTVEAKTNALFTKLIRAFEAQTGVPMLLNTSFNENEPVVNRPQEALETFLRTNMDVLVLGKNFIQRIR